jgi:hypothetical protein
MACLTSTYSSYWMTSTTTSPPPIPPLVARAMITISIKCRLHPSKQIERRCLCVLLHRQNSFLSCIWGNISSTILGLLCISKILYGRCLPVAALSTQAKNRKPWCLCQGLNVQIILSIYII